MNYFHLKSGLTIATPQIISYFQGQLSITYEKDNQTLKPIHGSVRHTNGDVHYVDNITWNKEDVQASWTTP